MKWEYTLVNITQETLKDLEKILNSYGGKGWELISMQDIPIRKIDRIEDMKTPHVALFKRQVA